MAPNLDVTAITFWRNSMREMMKSASPPRPVIHMTRIEDIVQIVP
jgi:hypothetical protein